MLFCGLQKTTLLDYPEHVAATVFLGGCNFRCPYCQNSDLLLDPASYAAYTKQDILSYLQKRKNILTRCLYYPAANRQSIMICLIFWRGQTAGLSGQA